MEKTLAPRPFYGALLPPAAAAGGDVATRRHVADWLACDDSEE